MTSAPNAKWMSCGTASTPIWESSMMNFTRTTNASEAVLGSQSIDAIKLNFIDHSRNAAATKLPSLAELFDCFCRIRLDKRRSCVRWARNRSGSLSDRGC